jgi:hypothetical protein
MTLISRVFFAIPAKLLLPKVLELMIRCMLDEIPYWPVTRTHGDWPRRLDTVT